MFPAAITGKKKVIYVLPPTPPHERRHKSKLINQLPYAPPFRGGIARKEKRKREEARRQEKKSPGGNVGVTSHKRNVRCGLID